MTDQTLKDINRAFKALEEQNELLDKIRTEIKAMFPPSGTWMYEEGHEVEHTVCEVLSDVLKIIDKYKADVEPQESEVNNG